MNPNDTARLVNLITSTWPTGVKGHVWTDTLGSLDVDHAHAAYIELRDHDERPPSVARFIATYHAHRTSTEPAELFPKCELCAGTGWKPAGREAGYSYVQPCHCTRGQQNHDTHARILEHNRRP